jgi:hypothetical protein
MFCCPLSPHAQELITLLHFLEPASVDIAKLESEFRELTSTDQMAKVCDGIFFF